MDNSHIPTDDEFKKLYSQSNIASAQRAGEKELGHLTSDDISTIRARCKHDLFFLTHGVLGYSRLSPRLHGSVASWLKRTSDCQYRMLLLPRGHYKTTLATIADSIQCALPGEDEHWPRGIGTNVRILLAHESHEGATRFLFEIAGHFCNNPRLMALFPECVPSSRIQRMNKVELELPRTEGWAEPTFDTRGVGGHSQGRHYNYIKLDDLFGDKARDSKAEREATIQWFDNILSFMVRLKMDHMDLIGTRYSLNDLYEHAMKMYGPRLVKYIRRIKETNVESGKLEPIFPEEFTDDSLAILKKNPKVWNAQYVNDPHEGLAEFDSSWKRFYHWTSSTHDHITIFTGAGGAYSYKIRDLDINILIDPAPAGKSGFVVTATDDKMRVFIIEAIKVSVKPPEFINLLFKLVTRWWPRVVAIEEVVFSALYKPWLEREMQVRNCRFNILMVKPKKLRGVEDHSKPGRVRGLESYFSAGQIYFHESQVDLIEEFDSFGATDDYHLLDALAYGPEVWRAQLSKVELEKRQKVEEAIIGARDVVTGY